MHNLSKMKHYVAIVYICTLLKIKMERFYLDIHALQTLPPSCVNRDDMGSPKSAIYGGVRRARVSSQAWKHAMRAMFNEENVENFGVRTKKLPLLIEKEASVLNPEMSQKDLMKTTKKVLETAKAVKKKDSDDDFVQLSTLFFASKAQISALAKIVAENSEELWETETRGLDGDKKKDKIKAREKYLVSVCSSAINDNPSIDLALFGRMVAADASLNYDAAAQVAHAISTHAVQNEFDFFTALDDAQNEDSAGAGHLDTTEFNSFTAYRYATVNVSELASNLKENTGKAVKTFIDAFVRSMPTGKQNSFANRTLPSSLYVTIRKDQPVNMAEAFESPIAISEKGFAEKSAERFVDYVKEIYGDFVEAPEYAFAVGKGMKDLVDTTVSLKDLLDQVEQIVNEKFSTIEE